MLAIIAHQIDTMYPNMLGSKPRNRFPATVLAPVVDKDDFVIFAEVMKNGLQA